MTKPALRKTRGWAARLGSLLEGVVEPALAARGLGETSLVTDWPEIVGAEIARYARPIQLRWPPRGAKRGPEDSAPATLVLRIDGAFALEAQHAAAIIVERVNAHLGWRCVEKIAFRQGPLLELKAKRRAAPAPSAKAQAEAAALADRIDDEGLRQALTKLGARAIDSAARTR
ncbi:MAG: DciA family protein [Roseiarcus sp.]|jgi:hypothetical protein